MSQDIDLQAQMEGESSIAHHSYQTYRDMGVSRTLTAAYAQYLKEIGKFGLDESRKVLAVSKSFRQWSIVFSWDDRAKDWDAGHAKRLQAKLLEADQDKYINSVENLRSEVESAAKELMQGARLNNAIAVSRLQRIATNLEVGVAKPKKEFEPMSRTLTAEYSAHSAAIRSAAATLTIASEKLSEALGLEKVITELNNAKDSE